ncbi:MAG TPA: methyltransferase domain-containing protein [Candidatus Hydrogenedentes bacterium]|nr:methyltransferase domain-containing protein [Candidatus Hydrogenedentota bacterium]
MTAFDWTKLQKPEELELTRKYRFRSDFLPTLFSYLRVQPGMKVVDVGCGTGSFTLDLARAVGPGGCVTGIDLDERLLTIAGKRATRDEVGKSVRFLHGSAYEIPLPNGQADAAVCISLLQHLRAPVKALVEMKRIVTTGGSVSAVEGVGSLPPGMPEIDVLPSCGFPANEQLCASLTKIDGAWLKHVHPRATDELKTNRDTKAVIQRIPALFHEAGFHKIELNGHFSVFSFADSRNDYTRLREYARDCLSHLQNLVESEFAEVVAVAETESGLHRSDLDKAIDLIHQKSEFLLGDRSRLLGQHSWIGTAYIICAGSETREECFEPPAPQRR